jgi:hypothetical protein
MKGKNLRQVRGKRRKKVSRKLKEHDKKSISQHCNTGKEQEMFFGCSTR